jgi:hypothetical protein
MMPTILIFAILSGILLWGLMAWVVLRTVFVKLSGWDRLSARFRVSRPPEDWDWRKQTVKVGSVRYRRTVNLAVRPEGLYLADSGLLWHPPLCVPWVEMTKARRSSVYGRPAVSVSIGTPVIGTLEFYAQLYQEIQARASRASA